MKLLKNLLKPLVGIGIIFFLIKYGGLDPKLIGEAFSDKPVYLITGLVCYLILAAIAGYRWYLLLECGEKKFTFPRVFSLHMIGLFFVTLLPGGTGGDVAKGYYLYRDSDTYKGFALSSIVMDRIIGFYTLLTWGMVGILINLNMTLNHPVLKLNALFYISCYIAATLMIILFFLPQGSRLLSWIETRQLPGQKIIQGLSNAFKIFRKFPGTLLVCYVITFFIHGGILLAFYFSARSLLVELSIFKHAFVVPILTLINGLPLTPGGIGVGEGAAKLLYNMINVNKGAEILALYHFYVLISALIGAPFYFSYKKNR